MKKVVAITAVFAILAACSDSGEIPAAGDPGDTAPAAAAGSATTPTTPAALPEGPAAGLWRISMQSAGMNMPPNEVCYETAMTMAEAEKLQAQAGVTCTEQSYRREGDAIVGHSVCTMENGMKVTTDSRVTGDMTSSYTMEMTSSMDPPPMPGMESQHMTLQAERIGDC